MRSINAIIIHCTATEQGHEYTDKQVLSWFTARGWTAPGYHYLVHLDGTITNLYPIEEIANGAKGYNSHSIHIAYIGGLRDGKPFDTRTVMQKESIKKLVIDLATKLDIGLYNVRGHNELAKKACPCYNVLEEISSWQN